LKREYIARYLIGIGDPELTIILPSIKTLGFNLDNDEESIRIWCASGTASNDQLAILAYSKFLQLGFFGKIDMPEALRVLEKYSSPSYYPAMFYRARLLFDIDSTNIENVDESASIIQMLAEDGYGPAICSLAFSVMESKSELVGANTLMRKAVSLEEPAALYWQAKNILDNEDFDQYKNAIQLLTISAKKNYAAASGLLSAIYKIGRYGIEKNVDASIFYEIIFKQLTPPLS
jgi:TPR repeat protein